MLLLIVLLKAGASCADDKNRKESTDRLRCLDGLRSGGSIRCCLDRVKGSGVKIIELTDGGD